MLISLDIETKCNVEACTGRSCDHGLNPRKSIITVIGVYWKLPNGDEKAQVFRDLDKFKIFIKSLPKNFKLLGHNLKFDLKHLLYHGVDDLSDHWEEDANSMAVAYTCKIDDSWLLDYEEARQKLNKEHKSQVHRKSGKHGLKTLYPYFCEGEAFWEVSDKENDEYVLKDCIYTYRLYEFFLKELKREGTYDFYKNKLMPWSKMLYKVEIRGIKIDLEMLDLREKEIISEIYNLKNSIDTEWDDIYKEYYKIGLEKIEIEYNIKLQKALEKSKNQSNTDSIIDRYNKLKQKAIDKLPLDMNLNSPVQIAYIFKARNYSTITAEGKNTTGKATLEKLILDGHEDIKIFQDYKKKQKLLTSFFARYKEDNDKSIMYTNFNIAGTRTGRLSSNDPNLQQVPRNMHNIFIARDGYKLATYDLSGAEPIMIAYFSEDRHLCQIILNQENFHDYVTKELIEYVSCPVSEVKRKYPKERDLIKQIDLSVFYGSGLNRMSITALNHKFNWTEADCRYKLNRFKQLYAGVFKFKRELDNILINDPVVNVMGRHVRIDNPEDIYMNGFNTLIQSCGSDIVLQSALKIQNEFTLKKICARILLLVHDEIVVEIPENNIEECKEIIIRNMTDYKLNTIHGNLQLQVEGKISDRWEK